MKADLRHYRKRINAIRTVEGLFALSEACGAVPDERCAELFGAAYFLMIPQPRIFSVVRYRRTRSLVSVLVFHGRMNIFRDFSKCI